MIVLGMSLGILISFIVVAAIVVLNRFPEKSKNASIKSTPHNINQIMEFLPDATLVIDQHGRVIAWNRAMAELTGIPAQDILGKGNYEYALPFYDQRRPLLLDLALHWDDSFVETYISVKQHQDGVLISESFHPNLKDGIYLSGTARVLKDENGVAIGAIESLRDISDVKLAEKSIKESERQWVQIMEFLPDATMVIDNSRHLIAWNQAMEKLTGVKASAILGKGDYEYAVPFYGERRPVMIDLVTQYDDQTAARYHHLEPDENKMISETFLPDFRGRGPTWLWNVAAPLYDENGRIAGAIESIRDITFLKQAEETLRREEERYKALYRQARETGELYHSLLESTLDAIVAYDPKGGVLFVNTGFTRTFGWVQEELAQGVPYTPESEREITMIRVRQVIEEGIAIKDFETVRLTKSGNLIDVNISASPFKDHEGNPAGMLVILRDITQRKLAEKKLAEALEEAERLRDEAQTANLAKSEFLANMSHELRTPLNSIIGFSGILSRSDHLNSNEKNNLDIIRRSGEHLLTLINDVLELSKIEAGKSVLNENVFNLRLLIDDIAHMLETRIKKKNLELITDWDSELPDIIATDEGKVRQVLINLIGNAIKFTEKGKITVRVRLKNAITVPGPVIRIGFEVSDTGIGIAENELTRLFEAFSQANQGKIAHEGVGLGLAICRKFVAMMQGDIRVESQVGKGSVFKFEIQAQKGETRTCLPERSAGRVIGVAPDQDLFRILIVDDEASNRKLLFEMLSPLGFDLQEAENGLKCIEIAYAWHPHMILMDMRMPVMDGYQAVARIKADKKMEPPVIIAVTASAFEEQKTKILESGCDDIVSKPLVESVLYDKLKHYLGVKFIYEKPLRSDTNTEIEYPEQDLTKDLKSLEKTWKSKIRQAVESLDQDAMIDLIGQIQNEFPRLADMMMLWVDRFEYYKIIDLISIPSQERTT